MRLEKFTFVLFNVKIFFSLLIFFYLFPPTNNTYI